MTSAIDLCGTQMRADTNGWMNERMDGWMDGRMGGRLEGQAGGWVLVTRECQWSKRARTEVHKDIHKKCILRSKETGQDPCIFQWNMYAT